MMKKTIYRSLMLALASLSIYSCNQEQDIPTPMQEEYVELTLSLQSQTETESEAARALYYLNDQGKLKYKFAHPSTSDATEIPVKTYVFKGDQQIYFGELQWTIENEGTRLSYNGPLKIKADALVDAATLGLTLVATLGDGDVDYKVYKFTDGATHNIKTPFLMRVPVRQEGNKLTLKDTSKARFKPWGTMAEIIIKNNMAVPTAVDGYRFQSVHKNYTLNADGTVELKSEASESIYSALDYSLEEIVYIRPNAQNEERLFVWLPFEYASSLPKMETRGYGAGDAVATKVPTQNGSISKYTVTVEPGDNSKLPYGLYISNKNIAQVYIDMDRKTYFYHLQNPNTNLSPELAQEGLKKYLPDASIGDTRHLSSYTMPLDGDVYSTPSKAYYSYEYAGYLFDFYKYSAQNPVSTFYYLVTRANGANKTLKTFISHYYPDGTEPALAEDYAVDFLPYTETDIEAAFTTKYWTDREASVGRVVFISRHQIGHWIYEYTSESSTAPSYIRVLDESKNKLVFFKQLGFSSWRFDGELQNEFTLSTAGYQYFIFTRPNELFPNS